MHIRIISSYKLTRFFAEPNVKSTHPLKLENPKRKSHDTHMSNHPHMFKRFQKSINKDQVINSSFYPQVFTNHSLFNGPVRLEKFRSCGPTPLFASSAFKPDLESCVWEMAIFGQLAWLALGTTWYHVYDAFQYFLLEIPNNN